MTKGGNDRNSGRADKLGDHLGSFDRAPGLRVKSFDGGWRDVGAFARRVRRTFSARRLASSVGCLTNAP